MQGGRLSSRGRFTGIAKEQLNKAITTPLNNLPGEWQRPIFLVLGICLPGGRDAPGRLGTDRNSLSWKEHLERHLRSGCSGRSPCPGHAPVSVLNPLYPFLHVLHLAARDRGGLLVVTDTFANFINDCCNAERLTGPSCAALLAAPPYAGGGEVGNCARELTCHQIPTRPVVGTFEMKFY